jgi:phosphoenolpyruvate-protein kinase (PTS system EI component)
MLDLKELTVEMLKENRSDIYEAVHKVGFDAGIAEEYKKKTDAITAGELFSKETVEKNKQEFDTSISEKVSEIEKVKSEFSKTLTEKDASIAKLTEEKDAETKKFTDKEAESKKLTAELAVEKKWSTLSESYKEEDAKEIKGILLKSEMGEALSKEETESLISKKISASSLLTSTATIIETGITDENRKNELRKLGGIKPKVK